MIFFRGENIGTAQIWPELRKKDGKELIGPTYKRILVRKVLLCPTHGINKNGGESRKGPRTEENMMGEVPTRWKSDGEVPSRPPQRANMAWRCCKDPRTSKKYDGELPARPPPR